MAREPRVGRRPSGAKDGRLTPPVDTFSLGCMLHYCLSGGGHPFGERYERDANAPRAQNLT